MAPLSELQKLYRQGRLIPFIGAGVSMAVGWRDAAGTQKHGPSWRELVDQAAGQLHFSPPDLLRVRGSDLQILEYFGIKHQGFAKLTNWMFAEMRATDDALTNSPIHRALANLNSCTLFYTTNFDDFLERGLELHGRSCDVVALEAHMGSKHSDTTEVVKFHGDFDHPGMMVLSESHYERRLVFQSPMDLRFRSDVLGRVVLFLGYSFSDANVSYLFHLVNTQLDGLPGSPSGRRAYILVPDPSDFEYQLFQARNMEVIPIGSRTMTEDIADILHNLRGD